MAEKPRAGGAAAVARVRASKAEFKRLDEVYASLGGALQVGANRNRYNKLFHRYDLKESSSSAPGKDGKWDDNAFLVRRKFDWEGKYHKTFVDVKSPEILGVLREVLKDISGVSLREAKPTVDPNLLFNCFSQLEGKLEEAKSLPEESQNNTLISHLTILIDYISTDYESTVKQLYPLLSHNEITFDLLWALFVPNTYIYTVCGGSNEPRCFKLDWAEEEFSQERGKFFRLDCHYLNYDGKTFGDSKAVIEIGEFRGAKRIDSLGVFPLAYHEEAESVGEKLIQRGRKLVSLKGMHYRFYKGVAFFRHKKTVVKMNVNGRIMIDPNTFRNIKPNYRVSPVMESSARSQSGTAEANYDSENGGEDEDEDNDNDEEDDINTTNNMVKQKVKQKAAGDIGSFIKLNQKKRQIRETEKKAENLVDELAPEDMTEEELLLCSATLLGFSFEDKLWAEFAVEHVQEIEFNSGAFESLVLPEGQKDIVRALVESNTGIRGPRAGIDDVIKGKGKGLVIALHGRPGVGKTLTAEGISDFLKRPLYSVGVGELGTDASTLEKELSRILDLAHTWGAVLLLDEADVFLERRTIHDLQRNALVSIFLRLLEYFQGILFLTTNRVESFDDAFKSRIHIALRYDNLDKKARKTIWKTFLERVAREEREPGEAARDVVNSEELEDLARHEINGREIKNIVTMAQDLALHKNERLAVEHLKLFLAVTESFENDLKGIGQLDSMMSYA